MIRILSKVYTFPPLVHTEPISKIDCSSLLNDSAFKKEVDECIKGIKKAKDHAFQSIWHPSQWKKDLPKADMVSKLKESDPLQKYIETEEDYSDLEGPLNEKLAKVTVPISEKDPFSATDLIVFKDKAVENLNLPINGILESTYKEACNLLKMILGGKTKIHFAYKSSADFIRKISSYFVILLTRKVGIELLFELARGKTPVIIEECESSRGASEKYAVTPFLKDLRILKTPTKSSFFPGESATGQRILSPNLSIVIFFHELVHSLRNKFFPLKLCTPPLYPEYDNEEEQVTIAGFSNEIKKAQESFNKKLEKTKEFNDEDFKSFPDKSEISWHCPINEQQFMGSFGLPLRKNHRGAGLYYFEKLDGCSQVQKKAMLSLLSSNGFLIDFYRLIEKEQDDLNIDIPPIESKKSLRQITDELTVKIAKQFKVPHLF